ncbi:MAG: hypothetical protein QOI66_2620 [Myxococcales bacterium]|jgi:hypothetical protein|nr:hypothetical protein [Myxococcales bacterium]
MADETKTTKASKTPKAAKAPKAKKADSAETAAAAATDAPAGEPCRVEKCKQAVRAKGYCRKHFIGWRRGAVGNKHRYKVCSKEGCRKPRTLGGLCDEHGGKAAGAPAEATG